ncbi:hypothetical protein [Curtobacterium sp. MCSS17_005]|uniref:hypothetical protein n=1 Tax=Curtobacterium sp. MCSS17_005 TaxID=2175641 RepID=UPI000DA7BDDE|nr:hypothetical protein [Curtobacterium sp. MCSS17_005]WIB34346.1 hypothetical protein DEJ20_07735 [Curtobacterium sp. MCSS17_005]
MRFTTAYVPGDDDEPELAGVEATDAVEAVGRLREVVGTDTDVLYVLPDTADRPNDAVTYETFLQDPEPPAAQ